MYTLEVQGLTKRFGATTAVDNVSFSVQPGECFALLGPSESGKTALLRLISGVETPDQGRILIDGKDVTRVPPAKRGIGMLFQNGYGLIPSMSVSESIAMPLWNNPVSKARIEQRVSAIAHSLQISHLLERKVSTLPEGERLRVALARALVRAPLVCLFDELFAHLDTPTHLEARRVIREIQQTTHLSCIYATHDQPDAFALANRVAVLNKGEMQQIGTRAELTREPATLWVAQWLGFPPMNTFTGYVQGTYRPEGLCYRVWARGITPLLPPKWTSVIESLQCQDIIIGVRPENIIPEWELREKWKPSFYAVKVEVQASEWNQGKTLAQLQLPQHPDEKLLAIFDISQDHVKIGQVITVAFDPEQFCLFHPRTQQLLRPPVTTPGWGKDVSTPGMSSSIRRPFLEKYGRSSRK